MGTICPAFHARRDHVAQKSLLFNLPPYPYLCATPPQSRPALLSEPFPCAAGLAQKAVMLLPVGATMTSLAPSPKSPRGPGAGTTPGFSHCGIPSAQPVRASSAFGEPTSPWGWGLTRRLGEPERRPPVRGGHGEDATSGGPASASPLLFPPRPCPPSPQWERGPERTGVRGHPEWARARLKASTET